MSAEVLPFRPRPDAPIQSFPQANSASEVADIYERSGETPPRAHFGMRARAAFDLAGETDRRAGYIQRAAKAAQDAYECRAPDPKTVCASLWLEASGRLNAGAAGLRDAGRLLESLGAIRQARTCLDAADIIETTAAELLIPITPENG